MTHTRRAFLRTSVAGVAASAVASAASGHQADAGPAEFQSKPWIELSAAAYLHNASQITRMARGTPIVAVLKNNAYGLGEREVGRILDRSPHVLAIAVVQDASALAMRAAGVAKPILLMGDFEPGLAKELITRDVILSVFSKSSVSKIREAARGSQRPVKVAMYVDTGLGRMGLPHQQVEDVARDVAAAGNLRVAHTFSTLTTPEDFAKEQIRRFDNVVQVLGRARVGAGVQHLAPSSSLLALPESHKQAVRPGILLHGSFPLAGMREAQTYPLQIPFRLKAPVVRLEKLRAGDTIGFSRFYKVQADEWIATLPIGWADGYDSRAENGAMVLLGGQLCRVVNVNASHVNVSLGPATRVSVGDVAVLCGPDRPEVTPEGFGILVNGHNYLQIDYKESIVRRVHERF